MTQPAIQCSHPGCLEAATHKVAATWQDGRFSELKTFGFACPSHTEAVASDARRRRESHALSPRESVGEIATYPLPKP
jgi:hypothetical protein